MRFSLFKQIGFEVSCPLAIIESFCYQSGFYSNFDLLTQRKVEDANKIGARIPKIIIPKIKKVTENTKDMAIFGNDIDSFINLNNNLRNDQIQEFTDKAILSLTNIKFIGLSKATKVYHTLYPKIIPMIDNPLQETYRQKINSLWSEEQPYQIFVDYYDNLKEKTNWHNISQLHEILSNNGLARITKMRIFDLLWWSFLKAEKLKEKENINWSTMRRVVK